MAETQTNSSLLKSKFTKANAYNFLVELMGQVTFTVDGQEGKVLEVIKDHFEPQAGGGASKNPSYLDEETGTMMHFCRFKQIFIAEEFMSMSNGKSKGASKLAAKHNYELNKQVDALKAKALAHYTAQEFTEGASVNAEAVALEAEMTKPETYSDDNLAQYIKEETAEDAGTTEAETAENQGE